MNTDKQNNVRRRPSAGFTLLELMVVILIIGLLATVVTTEVVSKIEKARVVRAKADIKQFEDAILQYKIDTGHYPESLYDLIEQPADEPRWNPEGYLNVNNIPADPWGGEYIYVYPGEYSKFDIISYGPDEQEGGDDDIYNSDVEAVSNEGEPTT
ncbi:MAG: type II secretion system major pseudopilin GspG [Sedimentisphaerales bacterium]|nr:type II secretion system major pseudopilin GspG [Sedimentisphaerales bacterium]